jgi:hypothetical protein
MTILPALISLIVIGGGAASAAPTIQTPQPVPASVVVLTGGTPITFQVVDTVSSGTALAPLVLDGPRPAPALGRKARRTHRVIAGRLSKSSLISNCPGCV